MINFLPRMGFIELIQYRGVGSTVERCFMDTQLIWTVTYLQTVLLFPKKSSNLNFSYIGLFNRDTA